MEKSKLILKGYNIFKTLISEKFLIQVIQFQEKLQIDFKTKSETLKFATLYILLQDTKNLTRTVADLTQKDTIILCDKYDKFYSEFKNSGKLEFLSPISKKTEIYRIDGRTFTCEKSLP